MAQLPSEFWYVAIAVISAGTWILGRLHGKVDWKHFDALKEQFSDMRETLGRIDQRTSDITEFIKIGVGTKK